jgi:hypothetical protein
MLAFEVGALANLRKQVRSVTGSVTILAILMYASVPAALRDVSVGDSVIRWSIASKIPALISPISLKLWR